MKKLNVVIVTVILALCCNTTFASTTLYSTLEKNEETTQMLNIPSPLSVFSESFGFFGMFIKGALAVGVFYVLVTLISKIMISSKQNLKSFLSHKKLGKIMDRMYEYKREV